MNKAKLTALAGTLDLQAHLNSAEIKRMALILFLSGLMIVSCGNESQKNGNGNGREPDNKSATTHVQKEPWSDAQLIQPTTLARMLERDSTKLPYLYSIGRVGSIKHSIAFGPAEDKKNLDKFRAEIQALPRDADIVIYCGCCPFEDCPNIRPAFTLLNEMGFTNHKLLNLVHNLNVDWIDKGYPVTK